MAETLFGEADLEQLNIALEASGWTEDAAPAAPPSAASPASTPAAAAKLPPQPPVAKPVPPAPAPRPAPPMTAAKVAPPVAPPKPPPPADDDPFDFLGLGRDAPLELIDEPLETQQRKEGARNR
jgi:hypothetical protein